MDKIREILGKVHDELKFCDPWKVTCLDAKERILELFRENDIPESEFKPWMCNNVLPELLLK